MQLANSWLLRTTPFMCMQVEGMKILVDDLVGSTGMELKADPGVPYVYAGFAGERIHRAMHVPCTEACPLH